MRKLALHPFIFSVYPILALFVVNIREIDPAVIYRSLIISFTACVLLFIFGRFLVQSWYKSGIVVSFFLLLFFTYGHLYHYLESSISLRGLGHHRILISIYALIFIAGTYLIIRKLREPKTTTYLLNIISVGLILFSILQIVNFKLRDIQEGKKAVESSSDSLLLNPVDKTNLPDIYYIVLDMYTREDVLQKDYGFDNSEFLLFLKAEGFYVAECSRSNHSETSTSISTTLNLDDIEKIKAQSGGALPEGQYSLLKHSLVRNQLKNLGYRIVAFETGYKWSQLEDADIYLSPGRNSLTLQSLNPFEFMLVDSTALMIFREYQIREQINALTSINHPWREHIELQLFNLSKLKEIPNLSGPKFVFAHILIPHIPFVFAADGTFQTDSGFWDGKYSWPINDDYFREGYIGQIQFINNQMKVIISSILKTSEREPIIVIMGDHGVASQNRNKILNAYYFPDHDYSRLYPGITPVNSFRIIFDQYYGSHFGKTDDLSYYRKEISLEDSPSCRQP